MKRAKMYIVYICIICCVCLGGSSVYAQSEAQNIDIQPDNVHQEITYGIWKLPDSWKSIFLNRETDAKGQKQYDQTLKELDQQSQKNWIPLIHLSMLLLKVMKMEAFTAHWKRGVLCSSNGCHRHFTSSLGLVYQSIVTNK